MVCSDLCLIRSTDSNWNVTYDKELGLIFLLKCILRKFQSVPCFLAAVIEEDVVREVY